MKPYYQLSDSDLRTWNINFLNVVSSYVGSYGITIADYQAIQNAVNHYAESLDALEQARLQLAAAQFTKDDGRRTNLDVVGNYARMFKANSAVPNEVLLAMGLPSRTRSGSPAPVYTPTDGRVVGFDTGLNRLDWNGNGNVNGTLYIVEVRYGLDTDWQFAGVSRRTKLDLTGCPVGVPTYYRVIAQRGARQSDASAVFVAYAQEVDAAA